MRFDRALVRVAAARECGSSRDQANDWFCFAPAPPWHPEELQESLPRKVVSAARTDGKAANKTLLSNIHSATARPRPSLNGLARTIDRGSMALQHVLAPEGTRDS
jgi:hypothetical protein